MPSPFRETYPPPSAAWETGVGSPAPPPLPLLPPCPHGHPRRGGPRGCTCAAVGAVLWCARFNVTSFVPPYFLLENVFTWKSTGPSSAEALLMAP